MNILNCKTFPLDLWVEYFIYKTIEDLWVKYFIYKRIEVPTIIDRLCAFMQQYENKSA